MPQGWASCPSPDGTELIFTSPGRCGGEGSQFTLSNGILMHKCSKKRVCPKGGRNYYGVPLVIDSRCDVTESKFERNQGEFMDLMNVVYMFFSVSKQSINYTENRLVCELQSWTKLLRKLCFWTKLRSRV